MITKLLGAASGVALLAAGSAHAVEFNGGEMALGYSAFTNEGDISKTELSGSVEFGFSPNYAAQLDLNAAKFGLSDADGVTGTLHGIYHMDDALSLGAFYGVDDLNGDDDDFFGVEAAYDTGLFETEGYLQSFDSDADSWGLGASGRYALNDQWGLGASIDYVNLTGGEDATRYALNADYLVADSTRLYAEVGGLDADALGADNEPFVGFGVSIDLGGSNGTTFGDRGLLTLIPGL